ncbi:cytochrome c oxidase subunit II [Roseospira navarrensis]|uniref:Cytochrome c oxidase subunit 2 n=1 Tax=Roseospira navarrensis TaxID=140058 RepID=A0A7X2D2Y2_9PROT|nr:cytochrome c oxidase subunit II [Roseospira navarrensis]MQX35017.1 cytochrome c oxidase subunit II [Roseospira navarrensis]
MPRWCSGRNPTRSVRQAIPVLAALAVALGGAGAALAAQPQPWQMWAQPAASPTMAKIDNLHIYLTLIMVGICLLVFALLFYVIRRFHHSRNPVASKRTHNTPLEIVWTLIPVLILVAVAFPSFRLLYFMDRTTEADMTVKVIGHQWYWSYEYSDHGGIAFDSFMKFDEELEPGEPRLLAVDEPLRVPVGANIRLLLTADDVLHSWAVPALGVKQDTVPGRLVESWMRIDEPGVYYGQCSELCGVNHAFMPIEVRALPQAAFDAWIEETRQAQGLPPADDPASHPTSTAALP